MVRDPNEPVEVRVHSFHGATAVKLWYPHRTKFRKRLVYKPGMYTARATGRYHEEDAIRMALQRLTVDKDYKIVFLNKETRDK